MSQKYAIVPIEQIPKKEVVGTPPLNDLMELYKICSSLENLCKVENGIGISAVQVGLPYNLFLVNRITNNQQSFEYYFDCSYSGVGEKENSIEGCLSIRSPDSSLRRFLVKRYSTVSVNGKRLIIMPNGTLAVEEFKMEETGLYAIVFQHEIDHQNGILISDIGLELKAVGKN